MMNNTKILLRIRATKKSKKPAFLRQNAQILPKLGLKWRRPKGIHSKLREHQKSRGFIPHPGYGSPTAVRYLHPSGLQDILVSNMKELENIDPTKQGARLSATIGNKKRIEMQKKAEELKIRIFNPKKIEKRGAK